MIKATRSLQALAAAICVALAPAAVQAHGDVTPQAVDTSALKQLGKEWLPSNPYRGDKAAIVVGTSAYNQNCARCHGIEVISGGIAPDLRYLPKGDEGDEIFMNRIRHGSVRDGRVYMPPFEGIFPQEAMWAIRAYVESVHEE